MDYDSDIQLKVSLQPADVKKSAKELQSTIAGAFQASAGKQLDDQIKKIQISMSKAAGKAQELQDKLDALETTRIPTDEYVSASKEVSKLSVEFEKASATAEKMKEAAQLKAQNVQAQMNELAVKQIPTDEYAEAQKRVDQYAASLIKAQERMDKFLETGGQRGSKQFTSIQYDISMWEMKLMDAEDELRQIVALGRQFTLGKDTAKYAQLEGQLQQLNETSQKQDDIVNKVSEDLDAAKKKVQDIVDTGKAFKLGSETDEYKKLSGNLADVNNQMRLSLSQMDSYNLKLQESKKASLDKASAANSVRSQLEKTIPAAEKAKNSMKKFAAATKTASKQSSIFNINGKKLLMLFLKYGFGIRSVYILINKLRTAVKDTVKEVAQLQDGNNTLNVAMTKITSSLDYMKRSIGTMFIPLVESLSGAIESFLDAVSFASEKIGIFIAQISGKTSYVRAIKQNKDYAKSLDETSKAADKANNKLGTYDKLMVISNDSQDEKKDDEQKFEEIQIEPFIKSMEAVDNAMQSAKKNIDLFVDSAKVGFANAWKYLDITSQIEKMKSNLNGIVQAIIKIFSDSRISSAIKTFMSSLGTSVGKVAASFFSYGLSLANNLIGGISSYLSKYGDRIAKSITDTLLISSQILDTWGDLAMAVAEVFKAFESQQAIRITASIIGTVASTILTTWNLVLKLVRDLYGMVAKPIIDNAEKIRITLENTFTPIATWAESIESFAVYVADKLNETYDNHIKPYYDALANGWSDTVGKFLDIYNEYMIPVLDNLASKFSDVVEDHVKPMIDKLSELFGSVADAAKKLYEEILKPNIDWLIETLLPVLMPILSQIGNIALDILGLVIDTLGNLFEVLSGIITFLTGVFTGDWTMAWEGIEKIASGIWNQIKINVQSTVLMIKNIINSTLTMITSIVTSNINNINTIIQQLKIIWLNVFNSLLEATRRVFNGIWDAVKTSINSILGGVERLINGFVSGMNRLVDILNNFQIDPPEWVTELTNIGSFGFNISHFREISIPRLAEGAVIPPNKQFLAVLGDQSSGTNIETPLDTMVQAFKLALADMGGGVHNPVVLQLNGRQIAQAVWDENSKRYKQSLNYFAEVSY